MEEVEKFNCGTCYNTFYKNTKDTVKVVHPASACACEYCGYQEWVEYKTTCPKCGSEVTSL